MKELNFKSKDGLSITANYYPVKNHKGLILLCHRSHCNRGEYQDTAPKLNQLGYSCLAIDQRSGMKVFGYTNKTKDRAKAKGLPTGYLDAKQDIEAAITYAYDLNKKKPILLAGSSYSAALSLLLSAKNPMLKATLVFSPGEYLKGVDLASEIKNIDLPVFATSAKKEIDEVKAVFKKVNKKHLTHFKPKVEGFHGSKLLWDSVKGHGTYWKAMELFLEKL